MTARLISAATLLALTGGLLLAACAPAAPPAPAPTAAPATTAAATPTAKPATTPAPPTPTPKPEKVTLSIPSGGFGDLFTTVADKKGFYREEGFEVEKTTVAADVSVKAVVGGEIAYTRAFASALRAAAQGAPIKAVLASQTRPPQLLVVRPEIQTVQDLKGKTVMVDALHGTTHVILNIILKRFGLDPEKDVTVTAISASPTRLQSVQAGVVPGTMLDLASAIKGESQGLRILANAADYTERIMGGIATSDKRIKEKPDEVLRFVRAHVKALKYIKDPKNKDDLVRLMMEDLNISRDEATKTYEMGIVGFSEDGSATEEAVKVEIETAREAAKITQEVPVSQVFDYSFVRKLKQ